MQASLAYIFSEISTVYPIENSHPTAVLYSSLIDDAPLQFHFTQSEIGNVVSFLRNNNTHSVTGEEIALSRASLC